MLAPLLLAAANNYVPDTHDGWKKHRSALERIQQIALKRDGVVIKKANGEVIIPRQIVAPISLSTQEVEQITGLSEKELNGPWDNLALNRKKSIIEAITIVLFN